MTNEDKFGGMSLDAPDALGVITEMLSVTLFLLSSGTFRQNGVELLSIAHEYAQAAVETADQEVRHG